MPSPSDASPALTTALARLEQRRATRQRFLHALYEAAEGSTGNLVPGEELGAHLGLTLEQTWIVRGYLASEGLLKGATTTHITLTHQGIKEVEEGLVAPARPTEHFPPVENLIVIASAEGAVIQQGNTNSVQEVTLAPAALEDARRQAAELEARIRDLEQQGVELGQLVAEAATARAQLRAPRPRLTAVRETVTSVRDLLEGALATGKAAAGILTALGAARALLGLLP